MLRTIRADNFKCLDGFELTLGDHALLLGLNGSGKSTVIELLDRLRRFWIGGEKAAECFPASTRTRWQSDHPQAFRLELERDGYPLELRVVLAPPDDHGIVRIAEERIVGEDLAVSRTAQSPIQLETSQSTGQRVLVPDELSALPLLIQSVRPQSGLLGGPVGAMHVGSGFVPFRLEPTTMETLVQKPAAVLRFDGRNFASWLLGQDRYFPDQREAFERRAAEILPGFMRFVFDREGEQFRLWTEWRAPAGPGVRPSGATRRYDFRELSDGQRLILVLSALLEIAQHGEMTLILDEPDNYLALQEIQPLLFSLMDTPGLQLIIASHHPEIINWMARRYGYVLLRDEDGPVRVKCWRVSPGTTLPAADLVLRGDIDGGA